VLRAWPKTRSTESAMVVGGGGSSFGLFVVYVMPD
jgi:hypothetical protein